MLCDISIHALREEGDSIQQGRAAQHGEFLSTPSARRATASSGRPAKTTAYFYPRPPRGGRHQHADDRLRGVAISIHALREEGDHLLGVIPDGHADFYPRPPRGGRLALALDGREILHISIHALREEGDIEAYIKPLGLRLFLSTPSARRATLSPPDDVEMLPEISIHALREEGDRCNKPQWLPPY